MSVKDIDSGLCISTEGWVPGLGILYVSFLSTEGVALGDRGRGLLIVILQCTSVCVVESH
jgi:hypothetical protein